MLGVLFSVDIHLFVEAGSLTGYHWLHKAGWPVSFTTYLPPFPMVLGFQVCTAVPEVFVPVLGIKLRFPRLSGSTLLTQPSP